MLCLHDFHYFICWSVSCIGIILHFNQVVINFIYMHIAVLTKRVDAMIYN